MNVMAKCSWCGKLTKSLNTVEDNFVKAHLCMDCNSAYNNAVCIKCGRVTDNQTLLQLKGICLSCLQLKLNEKSKKQEEIAMGVDRDALDQIRSEVVFTDEDYEQWLTMGKAFSPDDMQNSRELRRLWIIVKLNASGVYDGNVISDNIAAIETLLDRNLQKLINRRCRVVIANTSDLRREVLQETVIDYEEQVYILDGLKN